MPIEQTRSSNPNVKLIFLYFFFPAIFTNPKIPNLLFFEFLYPLAYYIVAFHTSRFKSFFQLLSKETADVAGASLV